MLKILHHPAPELYVKAVPVEKVTADLKVIAEQMYETMKAAGGIGLAANQVGLTMSLLVLEDNGKPLVMFNPKTMKQSAEVVTDTEGCLSFPGHVRKIKRQKEVSVKYRDENNKMQFRVLTGLQARAYLHERQHLDGQTFLSLGEEIK